MNRKSIITLCLFLSIITQITAQNKTSNLTIKVSFSKKIKKEFKPNGRLFLFLNKNPKVEPRRMTWPSNGNYIFAKNIIKLGIDKVLILKNSDDWTKTSDWSLNHVPNGTYYVQLLWDQDTAESRIDAPGNIYSEKQKIVVDKSMPINLLFDKIIAPRQIVKHNLVKVVDIVSDTLSKWWGKPIHVKASILLPSKYKENPNKAYPIRYNVAGYGGRYDRINRVVKNKRFMDWWQSDDAPQIINVFLDGEGPFGDSYQMDSDNSGPYGYSLINELAPYIEKKYRGTNSNKTRFVDGCSTGGWVSLGLQLYYPNFFNGVYSYSPDAIDFENYQLINIYKDKNAFTNEYGYLRPVMRDIYGEPIMSLKKFIQYENVLGASNTYLNSGGQFSAHTALYSPKGKNGLPKPLFDPKTGEIDHSVAKYWEKYDFKKYAKKNWKTLGPKIQGKIFIWIGDMDNFYLNTGVRGFDKFIKKTTNPVSDAIIKFSPMEGHCWEYSPKKILLKMAKRVQKFK